MTAQTTARSPDRLLSITAILLKVIQGMLYFIAAIVALVIPVAWIARTAVIAEISKNGALHGSSTQTMIALTLVLLVGLGVLVLGIAFVRRMIAIVGSVAVGTPFIPENARRLRQMAWLVVASQGFAFVAGIMSAWLSAHLPQGNHVGFEVSFEGILTALLLFVLAQVFEHGTRLTDDAEGTV